ncbi:Bifunctional ATP-dependent dihydroxyacetone kinase/FAD-AMP lyase (cyclizing) [Dufourea novaeangliae]|uniref:Triokinase/FMN cyclase n=2 Tax=Dufourea novaeangliae TaxID=178035 RepID=A0A154PGQ1_DUFNO|nr:Bifunctional ATP-dependent dihydroxyacetone kinase/FAD-AMP lyase (cyclizing) [Dufourea novaeangliae]
MKSLINSLNDTVTETLSGLSYTYPQLEYQESHKVFLMPNLEDQKDKVSIICGGGSGHEPFAAGFVGSGMLTASVAGSIFAAPPSQHVSYCIERLSQYSQAGILVVIPNYTGDCLNFGIAVEKARQSGFKVTEIIVNDDCSIPIKDQGVAGKRGLTGLLFVIKIAGALAERGLPLEEIYDVAQNVLKNMATYAVGLTPCNIPGQPPMFELADDEIECGMGVHGEAGYEKAKLKTCSEVVSIMLKHICDSLCLINGDSVAAIINNFGALSQLEQGIVVHDLANQLREMNIELLRVYSGVLMTSLNSAGIHITLLKLPENYKDMFISYLDSPTAAPRWPGCAYSVPLKSRRTTIQVKVTEGAKQIGIKVNTQQQNLLRQCLKSACERIIEKETVINDLDRGCGDGDCGTTLKRLASDILQKLDNFYVSHPSSVFSELAHIAEEQMGGTSGALYCLLFTSLAAELVLAEEGKGWLFIWAKALRSGLTCLIKYGKAKPGDRSMIDVMNAVCETYESALHNKMDDICTALKTAAWEACEATKNMKPKVGRASYVKQVQYLKNVDAGAYGVATWIGAIADVIKSI